MSENLFTHGGDDAPKFELKASETPINICDLLVKCGLCSSKGEARRLIEGGGVSCDGERVSDIGLGVTKSCLLKKGKKNFIKVEIV